MSDGNAESPLPRGWTAERRAQQAARNRQRRKYALNEHYFDKIDTPEQAYWLGFIAGDGSVSADGTLRVTLAPVDADHLTRLASALGSDSPIRRNPTRLNGKRYERVNLAVYSLDLVAGLAHQGIEPRKTWCMQPWNGPAELMRHYWRGLVDADGTLAADHPQSVRLVGTEPVMIAYCAWMKIVYPTLRAQPRHKHGPLWGAGVSGRVGAQAIAAELYGDCTVALPRKAERAALILAAMPPVGPAMADRTPEARARRSAFHAGQVPSQANLDARRTPESRERARQRALGRKASEATLLKMSATQRRRYENPEVREATRQATLAAFARRRAEREAAGLLPPPPLRHTNCGECGADITHRAAQARFCEVCRPPKAKRKGAT